MTSHLGTLVLFAALVSAIFAVLLREDATPQVKLGLQIFGGLVVGAYVSGWVMFVLFG